MNKKSNNDTPGNNLNQNNRKRKLNDLDNKDEDGEIAQVLPPKRELVKLSGKIEFLGLLPSNL